MSGGSSYGVLDRLLHRIALGSDAARRMAFHLEHDVRGARTDPARAREAVFVIGLARSGTTTLMRALHQTGRFRSLTYRDMPFVLMPRLWAQLSGRSRKQAELTERAHGDSILVGYDSPESFEEVFWMTFADRPFVQEGCLVAHEPSEAALLLFTRYIAGIASSAPIPDARYLSKNNNSLLRLPALRRSLPDATFLLLHRDPVQTAASLLRQHLLFVDIQTRDPFSLQYMNWLGHHEFGLGHKPFRLADRSELDGLSPAQPDYWLAYWIEVHEYLLATAAEDEQFLSYDRLCANPLSSMEAIGTRIGHEGPWGAIAATFHRSHSMNVPAFSPDLVDRARSVSERLGRRSL